MRGCGRDEGNEWGWKMIGRSVGVEEGGEEEEKEREKKKKESKRGEEEKVEKKLISVFIA